MIMKRILISLVMTLMTMIAAAQTLEPEFIGQVVLLNTDSTTTLLSKETTEVKAGSSKFGLIPIPGSGLLDKTKMRLILKGGESKTLLNKGRLTFIVRVENNDKEPTTTFSVLQFDVKKNKRQFDLAESGMLTGTKTTSLQSVPFQAAKYGENSYIVVIEDVKPGQYAFLIDDVRQVSTFGVK